MLARTIDGQLVNAIFNSDDFDYYARKIQEIINRNKLEGTIKDELPSIQKVIGGRFLEHSPEIFKQVSPSWFSDPSDKEWEPHEAAYIIFGLEPGSAKDAPICIKMLHLAISIDRIYKVIPTSKAFDILFYISTEEGLVLSKRETFFMLVGLMVSKSHSLLEEARESKQHTHAAIADDKTVQTTVAATMKYIGKEQKGSVFTCTVYKMDGKPVRHDWNISYKDESAAYSFGKNAGFAFFWLCECLGRPKVTIPLKVLDSFVPGGLRNKPIPDTPEIDPEAFHDTFLENMSNEDGNIKQDGFSIRHAFENMEANDPQSLRDVNYWLGVRAGVVKRKEDLERDEPENQQDIEKCNRALIVLNEQFEGIEEQCYIKGGRATFKEEVLRTYHATEKRDGTARKSKTGEQSGPNKGRDKYATQIKNARNRLKNSGLSELSDFIEKNVKTSIYGLTYIPPDGEEDWDTGISYEEPNLN